MLFQGLVSVCPSLEHPSPFCREGWVSWYGRLPVVPLGGTGGH